MCQVDFVISFQKMIKFTFAGFTVLKKDPAESRVFFEKATKYCADYKSNYLYNQTICIIWKRPYR